MVRRRPPLILASLIAVSGLSLAVVGCGGGNTAGVASVGSSATAATTTAQSGAAAFVHCMRSHGIPNWPDPMSGGGFDKSKLRQLGVSPTRIRAIQDGPCNHLLPDVGSAPQETAQQKAAHQADALSFARCMRNHGVARFPDPTAQGRLSVEMVQAQGIDVHSPSVLHVVQVCLPASHGALTPAKVREALNEAGG
jgi:hypothetical protein